jgi:hypothetical protein
MNKFESLIEHIINGDENRARAIFHDIVVERSRQIYESLVDEDTTEEDIEQISDEVDADHEGVEPKLESIITAEDAKSLMDWVDSGIAEGLDPALLEKVSQFYGVGVQEGLTTKLEENADNLLNIAYGGVAEADDELDMGGEMDMDMPGAEEGGEGEEGMEGGEGEEGLEDRVQDLEDALDDLQAEFDALMADEAGEEEHNDGESDPDFGGEEGGMFGGEEEPAEESLANFPATESKIPANQRKSDIDIMREYVEKVSSPSNTEGQTVGGNSSSKPTVNATSIVAGKNDMGGTSANIAKGGTEQAPDGQSATKKPSNQYTKGQGNLKGAGSFENVPGAKAGNTFAKKETAKTGEEGGVNKTTPLAK